MLNTTPVTLQNRIKPALIAQKEDATINYNSPRGASASRDYRPSTASTASPERRSRSPRMTKNAYGFLMPEVLPKLEVSCLEKLR